MSLRTLCFLRKAVFILVVSVFIAVGSRQRLPLRRATNDAVRQILRSLFVKS